MSIKEKAIAGMFWTAIQTFGGQIINFGVSIILARLLLPAEFGLIGMIGIFMAIGSTLIGSGLSSSIIRTTAPDQADYSTVFIFNLAGSILIYIIMFLGAPFIADFFKQPSLTVITRLYSLSFIINAFTTVQATRFKKELNFKAGTTASLLSTAISAVAGIILAYKGYGVMSLVWMALIGSTINSIILWIQSRWHPSLMFDLKKFRYHFKFGSRMMISGILDVVFNNIYTLVIGKFYNPAQLGFYNRADSLKQFPVSTLSSIIDRVTFPLFAEIKDDNVRLKKVYKQIMQLVIFVIAPILMLIGVMAEPLFRLLFTEKWLPAVPYFQILCISGLLYPLHSYNLTVLQVKGRSDLFLRLEFIKKFLLVIVLIASFPFGILGLIWGQVIFSIVAFFINTYYSGKFLIYGALEQLMDILPIIILTIAMGATVFGMDFFVKDLGDWARLLIAGLVGGSFFVIFARIFKFNMGKIILEVITSKIPISISIKFNPFR